jgi:urease accessory protein
MKKSQRSRWRHQHRCFRPHRRRRVHTHGFLSGFAHPLTGLDHLLAMLAVGVERAPAGRPWLPLAFVGMLLVGVATGAAGLTVPGLETGIALTVALMGVLLAVAARLPAAPAVMIGVFALLHGNAHGHELPQASAPSACWSPARCWCMVGVCWAASARRWP